MERSIIMTKCLILLIKDLKKLMNDIINLKEHTKCLPASDKGSLK